jgi:membrane-associated protease RseP (regulator of RpoE activity)
MNKRTRMMLYIVLLVLGLNSLPQRASANSFLTIDPTIVAQEPGQNNKSADKRPGENQFRRIIIKAPKRLGVVLENEEDANGLKVKDVQKGSVADKAGVQVGDVIINVEGNKITSAKELRRILRATEYGRNGQIQVLRNGNVVFLNFTLEKSELENQLGENFSHFEFATPLIPEFNLENGGPRFMFFNRGRLGAEVQNLTPQLSEFFGVERGQGLLVAQVAENSAAAKAGLKAGDVILAVNGAPIKNRQELVRELNKVNAGEVTVTVMRDKRRQDLRPVLPDLEKMRQEQQEEFKKRFQEQREQLKQRQGARADLAPAPQIRVFRKRGPGRSVEEIKVEQLADIDKIMANARRQAEDIDIDVDVDIDAVDEVDVDDLDINIDGAMVEAERALANANKAQAKAKKKSAKAKSAEIEKALRKAEKARQDAEELELDIDGD